MADSLSPITLQASKNYTVKTIKDTADLRGAPCRISSIEFHDNGHYVTFTWLDEDDEVTSETMTVADGVSVVGATINNQNHLIIYLSSGSPIDAGVISGGVPIGGTTGQILRKKTGSNYDTEWANVDRILTQDEYDALSQAEKMNGTTYFISNGV